MSSRAKTVKSTPAGAKRSPQNGPRRSSTTDVAVQAAEQPDMPVGDVPVDAGEDRSDRLDTETSVPVTNTETPADPSGRADVPRDEESAADEEPASDMTTEAPAPAADGGTPPSRSRRQLLFTAVIPLASIPLIAGLALLVSFVFFPEDETNPVSQAVEQQQRDPTETLAQGSYTDADGNEFALVVRAVDPAVVAERSANQGAGCTSEIPLDYYERGLLVEVSRPAGEGPGAALPRVAATDGLVAFPRNDFGCSWASADVRDRTLDTGQSTDVVGFLEPAATQNDEGELELRVGPIGDDQELTRVPLDRF